MINTLQVGMVVLSSDSIEMSELIEVLKDILQDKNVKDYLEVNLVQEKQRSDRNYVG